MSVTWRALERDTAEALTRAGSPNAADDARRIIERASGLDPSELVIRGDEPVPDRGESLVRALVARRSAGEPLQYVVGSWGFRHLDLYVDPRVLIPRPETEVVAGIAIDLLAALDGDTVAVDLGTGSGAIALAIASERWPSTEVWGTDVSPDALAVARANLAGVGRRASVVRLVAGHWYDALPSELRGRVDVLVSNPPYVADDEALPEEVGRWEPHHALFAGPTGLEAIAVIVGDAPAWLSRRGRLVVEIGETQAAEAARLANAAGFTDVAVHPDLNGRDRVLVAAIAPPA